MTAINFAKKRRRGATVVHRNPVTWGKWQAIWRPYLRWVGLFSLFLLICYFIRVGDEKLREPGAFPLRRVHIEGELHNLSAADFHSLALGYLGQNFFFANLDALNTALAANPWIEEVSVRRWWPDTIEIQLRERDAFGYWGALEMVDVNGVRFQPKVVRQPGPWPKLSGPVGHEKALIGTYKEIRTLLDPLSLKLVRLVQDDRRAWWLTFENGLEVYMGREQFEQRLQRLAQIYPPVLSSRVDQIAVIDMRYVNGFAVRWRAERLAPTAG